MVGAGRVGAALARLLSRAGEVELTGFWTLTEAEARTASEQVGADVS